NVMPNLSSLQQGAYDKIEKYFGQGKVTLLYGVTSSGKTEVYLHLMKKIIKQGKQVLYLLPEIALTAQLVSRLTKIFGTKVGVYHSKFSDAQRVEIYQSLLNSNEVSIILGVRSSIFLPFTNLGLIIVDEEHENTYKQQDPAPRYHARDTAIVMAAKYGANILLGSATPSVESYYNAMEGKYGLVTMSERYGNAMLPEIKLVNVKEQRRKPNVGYFSPLLIEEIRQALEQREQVILFHNRRGFSPYIECKECGWIPQCEHCNVSLTYHKKGNRLVCHYCGYTISMPHSCLACGSGELVTRGMGTQKVEEELEILFPDIAIERMDLDTTRTRSAYERIIADFENRSIQILIGTQMVTKGLDFDNVSLVGVLNADAMLAYPDFRSAERSFQLILQVAGRAGRRDKQGMVLVQTVAPLHPILQEVMQNDYVGMYQRQVEERNLFRYPPFVRLIKITLRHKDENILYEASTFLDQRLKSIFGENVKGPEIPVINRIQNRYLVSFLLKIERNTSANRSKQLLMRCFNEVLQMPEFRQLSITPDVDPMQP
ncbi:MAG: primosomal protein N', partial [Prevotellaceae bacterium]|nr:primosomal protein N' [Prevotellaceae bacterium]